MCLGVPARVVTVGVDHPDLANVDMSGSVRPVNIGLLTAPVAPGDWVLVNLGFAMSTMTEQEAEDALRVFRDERHALEDLLGEGGP
jgi:hydrogenase expression/formation protein HypC